MCRDKIGHASSYRHESPGSAFMTGVLHRRRRLLVAIAVVGVAWLAASAWLVLSARAEMVAAADELRAVRREASVATLVEADRIGELAEAEGRFRRASDRLGSPLLAPWRVAPVAGRHLGAARDLAQAGEEGSAAAAVAVEELQALTDRPRGAGPERIETLTDLATVADDTGAALGDLDLPSGDSLVGPLADAVVELAEQRDGRGGPALGHGDRARRSALGARALSPARCQQRRDARRLGDVPVGC